MDPRLTWETVVATSGERTRRADDARPAAGAGHISPQPGALPDTAAVTVRFASAQDAGGLERLAVMESKPVPVSAILVAEVDGELAAALSLADGSALADPFRPTAELVRLLELRETQLRGPGRRRRLPRWLRRFGSRRTTAAQTSGARYG